MPRPADHADRMQRARRSLLGLSVGDAFGERFFVPPDIVGRRLLARELDHPPPWRWTDDTAMALAVVETLESSGQIRPDELAEHMLQRYRREPWRGYGGGAHQLFEDIWAGDSWRQAAGSLFGGTGSFGNGAAMRVAPVGAYFAGNLEAVAALGDRDTTCAIVGGIVALSAPSDTVPEAWLSAREPLEGIPLEQLPVGD